MWTLLALSAPALAQDQHEVAFLLDVSCSMPNVTWGAGTSFEQVTSTVRDKARSVLLPYQDTDLLSITFYEFGDLEEDPSGAWVAMLRAVSGGEALSAREAIDFVDGFFPTDRSHYADDYTYVARSVYEVARRELALGGDAADAPVAIPDDARPLTVLVFTDAGDLSAGGGGESHARDRDYDHATWQAWLDEHVDGNQLEYLNWDLSAKGAGFLAAADHRIYNARWGQPSKAGVFDVERAAAGETALKVHPTFQLVPRLTMPPADREHVCSPRRDGPVAASAPARIETLAEVRWTGPRGRTERVPWTLEAPGRPLMGTGDDAYLPATSLPLRIVQPSLLLGDLSGYALGFHRIAFSERELCDALTGQYPHSTVVLPLDEGQVAPIAEVELVSRNLYDFVLEAAAGSPTAPWPALVADRAHVFPLVERGVSVSPVRDDTPPAQVTWTARVQHAGQDLPAPEDFLAFADGSARLSTPAGATVTLRMPHADQSWWRFGRGFAYAPGDYTVQLCARVDVQQPDGEPYALSVSCPACVEVLDQDAGVCAASTVTVEPRPIAWWTLIATALVTIVTAWASLRWIHRKRFDSDLSIGKLRGSGYLRDQYERGLDGTLNLFWNRACYLELGQKEVTEFLYDEKGAGTGAIIGLRPVPGGLLLWCVRHPSVPTGLTWKLVASTAKDALRPLDRDPGADLVPGETVLVTMPPPRNCQLLLTGSGPEGEKRRITYAIEIKG